MAGLSTRFCIPLVDDFSCYYAMQGTYAELINAGLQFEAILESHRAALEENTGKVDQREKDAAPSDPMLLKLQEEAAKVDQSTSNSKEGAGLGLTSPLNSEHANAAHGDKERDSEDVEGKNSTKQEGDADDSGTLRQNWNLVLIVHCTALRFRHGRVCSR
jgi:hypothetical protein